jgi:hypothetical protein
MHFLSTVRNRIALTAQNKDTTNFAAEESVVEESSLEETSEEETTLVDEILAFFTGETETETESETESESETETATVAEKSKSKKNTSILKSRKDHQIIYPISLYY